MFRARGFHFFRLFFSYIFLNENETPTTYIGYQLLNNHEKYNYLFQSVNANDNHFYHQWWGSEVKITKWKNRTLIRSPVFRHLVGVAVTIKSPLLNLR